MPATPYDSAIYRDLFGDAEIAKLFTDSAEVRAMLLVEGALAKAQGTLGLIPEISAMAIHRDSLELLIDPAGLAAETGQSAVVVPALVKAFRAAMQAPEHSQHVHFGATSQDIMETGLILRLRQVLTIYEARLRAVIKAMGAQAATHADLPMAARTYAQVATVTSFGAVVASWGQPLIRHLDRLGPVRDDLLTVSLSGAAGTLSAMGPLGPRSTRETGRGPWPGRSRRVLARGTRPDHGADVVDDRDRRVAGQDGRGSDPDDPDRRERGYAGSGRRVVDHAAEIEPGAAVAAGRARPASGGAERRDAGRRACTGSSATARRGSPNG